MRFMFTDQVVDLEDRLRAAGHEIESDAGTWAASVIPTFKEPRDYHLERVATERGAQVVVLVRPVRLVERDGAFYEFGFFRGHAQRLRQRGVTLVIYAENDPETFGIYQRGTHPGCVCRLNDAPIYVSPDPGSVASSAKHRRSILWTPGSPVEPLLDAIESARSGRTYSPKRGA